MKGLMYHSPMVYDIMIRLAHRRTFHDRIQTILKLIGNSDVLELGCGTATIEPYLPKNSYLGVDMNKRFVKYAQSRSRNVVYGDINFFENYIASDVTVLLMDILHHLPNNEEMIKGLLKQNIKQIVICEPFNLPDNKLHSSKFLNRLFDADGINESVKWFNKEELLLFYKKHNATDIIILSDCIIAKINKK
jgi:SAM-dependent methyltransferase